MKTRNQHIMHQVNIDINTKSESIAFSLQAGIDAFLKKDFFPVVNKLFDESVSPEEIRRFESIDLEISMNSSENFDGLRNQIIRQLQKKINKENNETVRIGSYKQPEKFPENHQSYVNKPLKKSVADQLSSMKDTFIYFLATGQLPWYTAISQFEEFNKSVGFNSMFEDKAFIRKIKILFSANSNALERFIQQFENEIIEDLFLQLIESSEIPFLKDDEVEIQEYSNPEKRAIKTSDKIDLKALYIKNAGLILAHPFLGDLFRRTNCIGEKNMLLPEKAQHAIHILHYLSTGQEQEMEYNLSFEKFLCGVPLNYPVKRRVKLSDQDKLECDDLLRSIIRHWPALKNTSAEGLRQMFFQRNGKLNLQKAPFKLYVERKIQDVLLDKLDWNISIVKLPWMTELLFVEW